MKNMTWLEWSVVGLVVLALCVAFLSCSDETTINTTEVVENHDHGKHRPYQSKSCQVVIDSLEAELEECRD